MTYTLDTLHPAVTAADYAIAALGREGALIVMRSLRAGALTPAEASKVEDFAVALGFLLDVPVPPHRGHATTGSVARADVAKHVARAIR